MNKNWQNFRVPFVDVLTENWQSILFSDEDAVAGGGNNNVDDDDGHF